MTDRLMAFDGKKIDNFFTRPVLYLHNQNTYLFCRVWSILFENVDWFFKENNVLCKF